MSNNKQSSVDMEFVPYEEALALKELGFDEPCFFAFDNCSTPMRCTDLRTNEQKFNGVNYNSSSYTSQPTFSQAFRWFREKHGLYPVIFPNTSEQVVWCIRWYVEGVQKDTPYLGSYTHEEAELACLGKLIEIVQGGNNEQQ